jgi:hypothetical protein
MPATADQIREEVVKIAQGQGGATAQDLVTVISSQTKVESFVVQRVLRSMLEKGAVVIDQNMNLIVPDVSRRR